jgi:hypothetical protein
VLSAHRRISSRSYTTGLNSPRPCFRKPDYHGLLGTTFRQCHVRSIRTPA